MEKEDKKGLAALLVSAQPAKQDMDEANEMQHEEEGSEMAVQDMMEALKTNDSALFRAALNAFLDMRN